MPKQKTPPLVEGAVSPAEAARFAAIANDILLSPWPPAGRRETGRRSKATDIASDSPTEATPHIGTLREKRLHAALKTYLCADTTCHECPVGDLLPAGGKRRHMVADILTEGHILEVQTGGLFPLRDKVAWYLGHTPCRVTVVHPIAARRYLSWIDPTDGSILSRRLSPKRGRVKHIAKELYWLSDFIGDPRFSVRILLLELEEYRMADGWGRDGKRGSSRYERFPTALLGDVTLRTPTDYAAYFLPESLAIPGEDGQPPIFTAADYAKLTGIRGKATYSMLRILEKLDLIRETPEKQGRSRGYVVVHKATE